MIFRPFTLLCLVAFLGAGLHVYQTKHEAAVLDRELRGIARKVEEAEARTQTLQAEWAWLNEPERLRGVAQRHLPALEPMQPAQFVRATEAERRLPAVMAYAGPTALFAARDAATPEGENRVALLPRRAAPVQLAIAVPAAPPTPPPVAPLALPPVAAAPPPPPPPAPVVVVPAAVAPAPAPAPAPMQAAPHVQSAPIRLALPSAPPAQAARAAEPPAAPRPVQVDFTRVAPPRPVAPAAPAPRPAARSSDFASLPPIAAPAAQAAAPPAPRAAQTQLAIAAPARPALEPPRAFAPAGYTGSALGGGTGNRPMLPPPVPFGSAGAATMGTGPVGTGLGR